MYRATTYMLVMVVSLCVCHVTCTPMDTNIESNEMTKAALRKGHPEYKEYHHNVKRDVFLDCNIEINIDRPGQDLVMGYNNKQDSAEACCQSCGNTVGCLAWTFDKNSDPNVYGNCWLKNGVPGQIASTSDDSGLRPTIATIKQDPHVMTFDSLKYNFNGYCSYTLVKSCDDVIYPPFEITADFRGRDPYHPYEPPTFMVAFNITSNGNQVIRINEDDTVLIKGKPMTSSSAVIGNDEGDVKQNENRIMVYLKEPAISLTWQRRIHGITIGLNDIKLRGKVCGLLGNDDGNPHNEFIKPDGERTFNAEEFGNSWLIPDSCP